MPEHSSLVLSTSFEMGSLTEPGVSLEPVRQDCMAMPGFYLSFGIQAQGLLGQQVMLPITPAQEVKILKIGVYYFQNVCSHFVREKLMAMLLKNIYIYIYIS